ncbi:proline and serine-rich protein 3 isoform X1 [Cyprinodon tularosa]|uniref:proline and serine-rich protein 3 isoform X1 n=1 Tax=Cyprinodon tularosa TaxID=77115 RepID=UPI0018E2135F|nr:proline and serine-rich protein 3 isoform X1 [Cyprinodon tularosa]
MKSSGSVFTRQNPFPPASRVKRAHYHPSCKQSLSQKEKKTTLSPVRLHQSDNHPPPSPNRKRHQLNEDLGFSTKDGQKMFTEIWPSIESESSTDSNPDCPEMSPDKPSVRFNTSTAPSGAEEDSVLAKYVERFRHGRPRSREERQQMASADAEEPRPLWWMAHSSVPSLAPTPSLNKDDCDSSAYSPAEWPQQETSFNAASDASEGEFDDKEILHLQERASRLLLEGECSQSDGFIAVSSDGLGCSDLSSPFSVDEPVRQPLVPILKRPTAANLIPDSASFQKPAVPSIAPPTRPEDDILFQWRLRRKMEQARDWSQSTKTSGVYDSAISRQIPSFVPASASGEPDKQQWSFEPPQFSESDPHMSAPPPGTHRPGASAPNPPRLISSAVPSSSSAMSQTRALPHVPAHMHLLCDVLPCPNQSFVQNMTQKVSEPQTKVVHRKTQVSESLLSTNCNGFVRECLPSSPHGNRKKEGYSLQKVADKKKKKKQETAEPAQKTGLPSRQQRKPARDSLNPTLKKKTSFKDGSEEVPEESCTGSHAPPSSPVHTALGQVVSEVLFPTGPQKTPLSSVSPPKIISPSESPVPLSVTDNSLAVISQLLQEAEDSDGKDFEDDPLLQVLRRQRKWVKDQIGEVDVMLQEFLEEQPAA